MLKIVIMNVRLYTTETFRNCQKIETKNKMIMIRKGSIVRMSVIRCLV